MQAWLYGHVNCEGGGKSLEGGWDTSGSQPRKWEYDVTSREVLLRLSQAFGSVNQ